MKASLVLTNLCVLMNLGWCGTALAQEQPPLPDTTYAPGEAPDAGRRERGPLDDREGRWPPVFGKISAIGNDSIEVIGPGGTKTTLKLTASTEYRKDTQPAKLSDFKVGDLVVVRTNQADGKSTTAVVVATGKLGTRGGPGGPGGGFGTLGKDFVIGEVKAIDPPRLTVMRADNVSQTLELNEETSLRRGSDSITMADLQTGDHVIARGAVENGVFVPKSLSVVSPEQWKRMQEMSEGGPNPPASPNSRPTAPDPPNVPEPQN